MLATPESIKVCKMLLGKIPPDPSNALLRCYFAYKGDYEKYKLVMQNELGKYEEQCLSHGIIFNLDFAYWVKDNLLDKIPNLRCYVSSKLIMNNDLSLLSDEVYCIWYPELPSEDTCRKLYALDKGYAYQIGRVCAYGNYNFFFELDIMPEYTIMKTAEHYGFQDIYQHVVEDSKKRGLWISLLDCFGYAESPWQEEDFDDFDVFYKEDLYYFYLCPMRTITNLDVTKLGEHDIYVGHNSDPLGTGLVSMEIVEQKINAIAKYLD